MVFLSYTKRPAHWKAAVVVWTFSNLSHSSRKSISRVRLWRASRLAVAPGIRSPCWAAVPPLRLSSHLRCSCRAPRHRLALAPMNWHGLCSCLRPAFGPHSDHISSLLGTSTEATTSPSCVETLLAVGASVWHPDPGVLFHTTASISRSRQVELQGAACGFLDWLRPEVCAAAAACLPSGRCQFFPALPFTSSAAWGPSAQRRNLGCLVRGGIFSFGSQTWWRQR